MGRPARAPPVLVAFLAFALGACLGGILGLPLAALRGVAVVGVALAIVRLRGHRPLPGTAPAIVLVLAGMVRIAVEPLPNGGRPPVPKAAAEPVSIEVEIVRSVRRDRLGTVAEARTALSVAGLPAGTQVRLRFSGYVDLVEGTSCVVRGRILPPPAPPESIGPSWPRPRSWVDVAVAGADGLVPLRRPGTPDPGGFDRVRARLASRIRLSVPDAAGDFALAVLLGEGRGLDPSLRGDLAALGTAHVLSVSGLHVAAAAFLAGLLVVRLAGPLVARRTQAANLVVLHLVVSVAAAWLVARLAGLPAPAVRSAGMFTVAAAGHASGRPQAIEDAVGVTGLLSIAMSPEDVFSASFLLSYAAMLGLAFLARPLAARLAPGASRADDVRPDLPLRLARATAGLLAASAAASLATTPVSVLFLGSASWVGPLANLLAVPATTLVVMPAALLLLVIAALFPPLLAVAAPPVTAVLDAFLASQAWLARVAPGDGIVSDPAAAAAIVGGCVGASVLVAGARLRAAIAVGAVTALATLSVLPGGRDPPGLRVHFLDVGKGDAILVECPAGRRYLVDAGEARTATTRDGLIARLRARGVTRLDGIVATHADEDHAGGIPAVLAALPVGFVAWPCPDDAQPLVQGARDAAVAAGATTRCLLAGMQALPGCGDDSRLVWPPAFTPLVRNAASVVFAIEWRGRRVLLTGDLEQSQEATLLERGLVPASDVAKLGHHGGRASSSPAFLAAVRPALAVVSGFATRQRRNLPAETATRVAATGARLVATRLAGDVSVIVDATGSVTWHGRRLPQVRDVSEYLRSARE